MKSNYQKALTGFLRVRCYIRYSTHNQDDGFSVEYQKSEIDEFLKKNDLTLEKAHIDQAQTATKVAGRDEFFALLDDVKKGLVDIIVVYKMNRIFRNAWESHLYRKIMREHNVKIMSVTQHIDEETSEGRFMTSTLANVDQYQAEITSDHVKSSMREMARQGYYTGGRVLYGYKLQEFQHGGKIRKKYTPNEEETKIVKFMFEFISSGKTIIQLMHYLKDNEIKNRNGKLFYEQVLLSMLRNDCYIGTVRYKVKGYDEIVTENAHEAIVDKGLFAAVQKQLNSKPEIAPRRKKYYYALTGKITCGECGNYFFGTASSSLRGNQKQYRYVYHSYVCKTKRYLRNCGCRQVKKTNLETLALQAVKTHILNKESIEQLSTDIATVLDKSPEEINAKIKEAKSRKRVIEKQLNTLVEMRLNGEVNGEFIKQRSIPLEQELKDIDVELYSLSEQQKNSISKEDIKSYLQEMLHKAENFDDKTLKEIFDCFIENVIISNDNINFKLRVYPAPEFAYKPQLGTPKIDLYAEIHRR